MVTRQRGWDKAPELFKDIKNRSKAELSPLARLITLIWISGTLILLPVNNIKLPFNIALVDIWILIAVPLFWLYFYFENKTIHFAYTFPIWLILVGSLISTFGAPKPMNGLIVITKEVYLILWFITLITLLSKLNSRDTRLVLFVWLGVILLHGLFIIAQFVFPEVWKITAVFAGKLSSFSNYRPAGFFVCADKAGCANKAAFFQLLGFVPLLLLRFSSRITTLIGVFIVVSFLATGSMGATIACLVGLTISMTIFLFLGNNLRHTIKIIFQIILILSILGGLFFIVINQNPSWQTKFLNIFLGRAERSSEGRFDLWQRGINVLLERDIALWGIGPENFRIVDGRDKQLHNDLLAFSVERGLLGTIGLVLLALFAIYKAMYLLLEYNKHRDRSHLVVVVFLAAIAAALVESQTHQIFHARWLWLVLAMQEAMIIQLRTTQNEMEPSQHLSNKSSYYLPRSIVDHKTTST
ncbi:MAG: O-antigen ligase family protein [Candidatus Kariarchaeaceae archaeon]|jgi:O-antigen ligase